MPPARNLISKATGLNRCLAAFYALSLSLPVLSQSASSVPQDQADARAWLRHVRIAAYPLSQQDAESIVQQANDSHVYGIEVDNDIPGRYESLLHPENKLDAIRKVSLAAHQHGQKTFVYIAGTECITADGAGAHTMAKDHPDWLQRKASGQPAIFDTKAAFWIAKGEEDTWVSPYAADWRKLYMSRVRQIAATGVDGIYIDIPYWMTHFTGWEDSWASFDAGTLAAFKKQTGLDAAKDVKIGDFEDPGFRKWIDFRIQTITAFLAEIRKNAVAVNPAISIIPEIYPGIESESTRVGADVYQLYPVVDAIAHEYEFGNAEDHTAASRPPFDWFMYQIGMRSFRAFGGDKPTWILNYSWDGAPHVKPADAMQTLFMSELMAGANVWDAQGHVMSGSNDMAERKTIYQWIADHDDIFGATRTPLGDVGVYFSDTTRNYYPKEFIESYRGTLLLMLQSHRQFQIVTPRTLSTFHGKTLVLPEIRAVSDGEAAGLRRFSTTGGKVVLLGTSDSKLNDLRGATRLSEDSPRQYLVQAEQNFAETNPYSQSAFFDAIGSNASPKEIQVKASKNVVVHAATVRAGTYLFFANFDGIKPGETLAPTPQHDIQISAPAPLGNSIHILPFLGSESVVRGEKSGDHFSFILPQLDRGAVVWFK
jgi:hypothetical protein